MDAVESRPSDIAYKVFEIMMALSTITVLISFIIYGVLIGQCIWFLHINLGLVFKILFMRDSTASKAAR